MHKMNGMLPELHTDYITIVGHPKPVNTCNSRYELHVVSS